MNRTIMIHTITGPIFCIGEELFRNILFEALGTGDTLMDEMVLKLETHLDQSPKE